MKEKGQSSDGLVEAVREYIPLLSSAIQMVFGTVFAFMFIVALAISTLIGMCQVHSLAGRVDALQTKIEEQDRIIDKQGQALEAVSRVIMEDQKLERQVRKDKTIGDALGDLLDSMHRIGEALHQQDPKVEMRGVW